jgi:hypothetical protein
MVVNSIVIWNAIVIKRKKWLDISKDELGDIGI